MDKYFVTIFFIGYAKFAPGTLGSLCGILTFYCLYNFFSIEPMYLFFLIFFIFGLGWYFTFTYIKKNKIHDPSEIIIDEFLGQILTLTPLLFLKNFKLNFDYFLELLIFAFLLFRFFDIVKLGLVGWADKLGGALGVILDDILAGIAAAITLTALLILT